ncbi:MAG: TIGR01212 family radical SAM protein [Lachnospiraceae bacterium]|nr:TIGR01212 family radical SAM protein [Lachnospiraceae bacterium]MDD6192914.1 TIGR01212 family radical SAM protein [Lachnospiraceae bacterium]MDY4793644.1 TIGR01212 family radical SAM protein [Pararoseburia sp.]
MEYYSFSQYVKDTFGEKVYKIALDGGFTCPNRDGSLGTRGCIFCSGKGSGDFAQSPVRDKQGMPDIFAQIEAGKKRVEAKNKSGKYIAYFQSFTNTYGDVSYMREVFGQAMAHPDIVAVSIGTRPDCLPPEVLDLLAELNKRKPVWVELGLQTIHPETARYIRRGYDLPVFEEAVKNLKAMGINVIVHCILGLPGETKDMMKETVSYIGKSGADGIKLQLLHVLKGTDLAEDYVQGRVPVMEMEEYVKLVADCIALLPKNMVIHRMTGDGDKKILMAPLWSGDKKRVWNALQKEIKSR